MKTVLGYIVIFIAALPFLWWGSLVYEKAVQDYGRARATLIPMAVVVVITIVILMLVGDCSPALQSSESP